MRVLVLEDDRMIRGPVADVLAADGYAVDAAGDGEAGRWHLTGQTYDLVILDLNLPGIDGLTLLAELRARATAQEPGPAVLIISARDAVADRVRGLDLGADDYLVKPFALEELRARARSLVRRRYARTQTDLTIAALSMDTVRRRVTWAGVPLPMTPREYALLEYLLVRRDALVTRQELWDHLYAEQEDATSNVVDHFVARLRRKLEAAGAPPLIHTRRGEGYVLGLTP